MKFPFHVIELLKRKSGSGLRLLSDCELLSLDIESKTKVRIGATTLKRLLGFAQDERTPHASTLDAIARYLGYAHWDELSAIEDSGNSNFEAPEGELRSADLTTGSGVEIAWLPDRRLVLRYLGDCHYHVVESQMGFSGIMVANQLNVRFAFDEYNETYFEGKLPIPMIGLKFFFSKNHAGILNKDAEKFGGKAEKLYLCSRIRRSPRR